MEWNDLYLYVVEGRDQPNAPTDRPTTQPNSNDPTQPSTDTSPPQNPHTARVSEGDNPGDLVNFFKELSD